MRMKSLQSFYAVLGESVVASLLLLLLLGGSFLSGYAQVPAAPLANHFPFTVKANIVKVGDPILFSWDASSAVGNDGVCIASGAWEGRKNVEEREYALEAKKEGSYDYSLTCQGKGTSIVEHTVVQITTGTAENLPRITAFTAKKKSISSNEADANTGVALIWEAVKQEKGNPSATGCKSLGIKVKNDAGDWDMAADADWPLWQEGMPLLPAANKQGNIVHPKKTTEYVIQCVNRVKEETEEKEYATIASTIITVQPTQSAPVKKSTPISAASKAAPSSAKPMPAPSGAQAAPGTFSITRSSDARFDLARRARNQLMGAMLLSASNEDIRLTSITLTSSKGIASLNQAIIALRFYKGYESLEAGGRPSADGNGLVYTFSPPFAVPSDAPLDISIRADISKDADASQNGTLRIVSATGVGMKSSKTITFSPQAPIELQQFSILDPMVFAVVVNGEHQTEATIKQGKQLSLAWDVHALGDPKNFSCTRSGDSSGTWGGGLSDAQKASAQSQNVSPQNATIYMLECFDASGVSLGKKNVMVRMTQSAQSAMETMPAEIKTNATMPKDTKTSFDKDAVETTVSSPLSLAVAEPRKENESLSASEKARINQIEEQSKERIEVEMTARQQAKESAPAINEKIAAAAAENNAKPAAVSYGTQKLQSWAVRIYSSGGSIDDKLNIVIAGSQAEFTDAELYALAKYITDHGFQMYTPFRENMSRINIWMTSYSSETYVDPAQYAICAALPEEQKAGCFIPLYGEGIKQALGVEYAIILSKVKFRSFSTDDASIVAHTVALSVGDYLSTYFEWQEDLSNIKTSLDNVLKWTEGHFDNMTSTAMHEFGHAFGYLDDEYVEENFGVGTGGGNCIRPVSKYLPREQDTYRKLLQSWSSVQGQKDWSYSDSGLVPVTTGMFTGGTRSCDGGCSYVSENIKSMQNSLMCSISLEWNVDMTPMQKVHLPYGWTNRVILQDKLAAYAGSIDKGCGDAGQKPCGYSSYDVNNGSLCYRNSAYLARDTAGNSICSACGLINNTPRCKTIQEIKDDGVYDIMETDCSKGNISSYGICIQQCGYLNLPICPEGTEGTINSCFPPFVKKEHDIGERCDPCPNGTVYKNGICPVCGKEGQPVCPKGTEGTKNGCYESYTNDAFSKLTDCEHLPNAGSLGKNNLARITCEKENSNKIENGTCIMCGYEGQKACSVGTEGTGPDGCFPPFVKGSDGICVQCAGSGPPIYNFYAGVIKGGCTRCGYVGGVSCAYNQESKNMSEGCVMPAINAARHARNQCDITDFQCQAEYIMGPRINTCVACPIGQENSGTKCVPCGGFQEPLCAYEAQGIVNGCKKHYTKIICDSKDLKCINRLCPLESLAEISIGTCGLHAARGFCMCGSANEPACPIDVQDTINGCFSPNILTAKGICEPKAQYYKGCFSDKREKRKLAWRIYIDTSLLGHGSDMIEKCIAKSRALGYKYAGLHNSSECWAGDNLGARAGDDECVQGCSGNQRGEYFICGGISFTDRDPAFSVYATGITDLRYQYKKTGTIQTGTLATNFFNQKIRYDYDIEETILGKSTYYGLTKDTWGWASRSPRCTCDSGSLDGFTNNKQECDNGSSSFSSKTDDGSTCYDWYTETAGNTWIFKVDTYERQ